MTEKTMLSILKKLISCYILDGNVNNQEVRNCNSFKELLNIVIKYGYDELIGIILACYKSC